jgi:CheY-like chemotaxis protein
VTVLLVEDDADDVLFLRRAWKKLGWSPDLRVETDGQAALDYLGGAAAPPERVILDVKLPRVSGLDVLASIRASRPKISAIILTSSRQPEDIARGYALGCDAYLVKPVTFVNLLRVAAAVKEWASGSAFPRIPEVEDPKAAPPV